MSDSLNEVDPHPPLQQLSSVVEPSAGAQYRAAAVEQANVQQRGQQQQYHQRQPQVNPFAGAGSGQQQQQHRPRQHHDGSRQHGRRGGGATSRGGSSSSGGSGAVHPSHHRQQHHQAVQQQHPQVQQQQPTQQHGGAVEHQQVQQQRRSGSQRSSPQHSNSPPSHNSPSSGGGSHRLPDSPEGPEIVKVSHRSRVSSVTGKIAHDVRDGRLPRIMVAGKPSISTATKAIVQARRYLRPEGQDIGFMPLFRSTDHSRALLELAVVLMPLERGTAADNLAALDNAGGHEIRISNGSRHARVGSQTARQLRARGINVLCSVGQEALANSVMASAHASCFLQDTGLQMVVMPSHVVLRRGDQELHSIKLVVTFA